MAAEELTLDGLELHYSPFCLRAFDHKPAKKMLEWVKGADSDGAKLLRAPKHETAEIVLQLQVEQQATMDAALNHIGAITDKLQEAERVSQGGRGRGLELVWSPSDSTFTGSFFVLSGEVEEIPKEASGEGALYSYRAPTVTVRLVCDPFIYGAEVESSISTSSLPLITKIFEDIPGDVPAEARFVVSDQAGQARDFVAIGIENYSYGTGPALLTDSGAFVTAGYAGSTTTRTGAYSANGVVRATLSTLPVVVCSSAELTHVGTFRNFFRLWASSTGVSVRLVWRQGRDQWTAEPWAQAPFASQFWEPDLGMSKIRQALKGVQTWQWRLEAKSTVAGATIDVDYHALVPAAEGYAKAVRRATQVYETPRVFSARDEMGHAAGSLTGKVLPVGGPWTELAGSAATDFATTGTTATRNTTADAYPGRMLTAGTTAYPSVTVQTDVGMVGDTQRNGGVFARCTDINNWVRAGTLYQGVGTQMAIYLEKCVAGVDTTINDGGTVIPGTYYRFLGSIITVRLYVSGGYYAVWAGLQGAAQSLITSGYDSDIAAMTTGKIGLFDMGLTGGGVFPTRTYDNFMAFVPTTDAVIHASQALEFRTYGDDPALRGDADGTGYWGRPAETRGGRVWLPPAGDNDRTSRVAVIARRADIETLPSSHVEDSTAVNVFYRPRWLNVPRQG